MGSSSFAYGFYPKIHCENLNLLFGLKKNGIKLFSKLKLDQDNAKKMKPQNCLTLTGWNILIETNGIGNFDK